MTSHSPKSPFSRRSVLRYMASAAAACPTCMSVASAQASGKKVASAAHGAGKPAAKSSGGHGDAHWGYEGDTGPQHWGDRNAGNKVCSMGF